MTKEEAQAVGTCLWICLSPIAVVFSVIFVSVMTSFIGKPLASESIRCGELPKVSDIKLQSVTTLLTTLNLFRTYRDYVYVHLCIDIHYCLNSIRACIPLN